MLKEIAENIWSVCHQFKVNGMRVSSRMIVIALPDGSLFLHSPVPISASLKEDLMGKGEVRWIIAPNKMHHLFLEQCQASYPTAKIFAAPGLQLKRPHLSNLYELDETNLKNWAPTLEGKLFQGLPSVNETVWFHHPSQTLIMTDVLQWWQGNLDWNARLWAWLIGAHSSVSVPRHVRWLVESKQAVQSSINTILAWLIEKILMAHNATVLENGHLIIKRAFRSLL
jgi:Domain of unknown function (DUF4336)